jgi:nucleotide-binding universal stress UspA family protein
VIAIQRVLCPVDLSEFSARALAHAVALARWYRAEVIVLHVFTAVPPPASVFEGAATPSLAEPDRQRIEDWVRQFAEPHLQPEVPARIEIREGAAAAGIVEAAANADLLVMGTHGRGGFERLLLGSTTEKVIRTAPCPVLTVPPHAEGAPLDVPAAFKRIVCATDFSPSSRKALEYALSLAQEADARLTLVHALDWPFLEPGEDPLDQSLAVSRQEALEDLEERLRRAIPEEARTWCEPEERLVAGRAHREIVSIAAETGAGLIVMGAQGRGALDRAFFGSTTSQVVRHATCPVLTVRAA